MRVLPLQPHLILVTPESPVPKCCHSEARASTYGFGVGDTIQCKQSPTCKFPGQGAISLLTAVSLVLGTREVEECHPTAQNWCSPAELNSVAAVSIDDGDKKRPQVKADELRGGQHNGPYKLRDQK